MREFLIAGNWKMNLNPDEALELTQAIIDGYEMDQELPVQVLICPPSVFLAEAADIAYDSELWIGAQNVSQYPNGAYTGEISAAMLAGWGAEYCIVGHSERRQYFGETDTIVNLKSKALLEHQIRPIICVGETLDERKAGKQKEVVSSQLSGCLKGIQPGRPAEIVIAYEPVWAIGTGETASPEQAQEMHAFIRAELARHYDPELADEVQILYGGSMKPDNARELLSCLDVDGGLIGGASLKAEQFLSIVSTAFDLVS
jgi:triosephosphate isomerase